MNSLSKALTFQRGKLSRVLSLGGFTVPKKDQMILGLYVIGSPIIFILAALIIDRMMK